MLVGILLIGQVSGSYSLAYLTSSGDLLRQHPLYPVILCCVLVGALTKSALFMVVGIIDHQTGSQELASVGGLVRAFPFTAAAAVAAGLSMAINSWR